MSDEDIKLEETVTTETEQVKESEEQPLEPVQFFKIITGEELFGVIAYPEHNGWRVMNPMVVNEIIDGQGNRLLLLHRWIPFLDRHSVSLSSKHVIVSEPASAEMCEYFHLTVKKHQEKIDQHVKDATMEAVSDFNKPGAMDKELKEKLAMSHILPASNTKN